MGAHPRSQRRRPNQHSVTMSTKPIYLMFDPNQSKNLYGFKRVEGQRVLSQFLIENLR